MPTPRKYRNKELASELARAVQGGATQRAAGEARGLSINQVRHYLAYYGHDTAARTRFSPDPATTHAIKTMRAAGGTWGAIAAAVGYSGPAASLAALMRARLRVDRNLSTSINRS